MSYRKIIENKVQNTLYKDHQKELDEGQHEAILTMRIIKKLSSNQFIRDYYAFSAITNAMSHTKNKVEVQKIYDELIPGIKQLYYRESVKTSFYNFSKYSDGMPAPDFAYTDVNGKVFTLKQLRGKYVYIDLWATWCGPCKREIPSLAKIEEDYKDKNIHFVSISVDKGAQREAWKSFVLQNKLKGIQLMVDNDFQSKFITSFNVNFIPRFILIDPNGIIKDGDAKRPSV